MQAHAAAEKALCAAHTGQGQGCISPLALGDGRLPRVDIGGWCGEIGGNLEINWRSVGDQLEISPADVVDVMHVVCVGRGRGSIM